MKNISRNVSILLALCMIVGLIPWTALPARAETGTTEDEQGVVHSTYTVEFTYDGCQYVMQGDSGVAMSEILTVLGLSGEVTDVEVSDTSLFSASYGTGEWIVTAHRAFSSTEWMKVTVGGVVTFTVKPGTNGYFKGELTGSFRVIAKKAKLSSAKTSSGYHAPKTYTGSLIQLEKAELDNILFVYRKVPGQNKQVAQYLLSDVDFEVLSYANNRKAGIATVTLKGKGLFGGIRTIRFKITKVTKKK